MNKMGNKNTVILPKLNQSENQLKPLHIALLGETFVGKTCLARTFESGVFEENTCLRIGVSRHIRKITVQNISAELFIWNVIGNMRYRALWPFYIRNADGVFVMYDVADVRSFRALSNWLDIVRKSKPDTIIFIVGARSDLVDSKEVPRENGYKFAKSENLEFFECSAKTGENVNEIFELMALRILQKKGVVSIDKIEKEGKSYDWKEIYEIPNKSATEEEELNLCSSLNDELLMSNRGNEENALAFNSKRKDPSIPEENWFSSDDMKDILYKAANLGLSKNIGSSKFCLNDSSMPDESWFSSDDKKNALSNTEKLGLSENSKSSKLCVNESSIPDESWFSSNDKKNGFSNTEKLGLSENSKSSKLCVNESSLPDESWFSSDDKKNALSKAEKFRLSEENISSKSNNKNSFNLNKRYNLSDDNDSVLSKVENVGLLQKNISSKSNLKDSSDLCHSSDDNQSVLSKEEISVLSEENISSESDIKDSSDPNKTCHSSENNKKVFLKDELSEEEMQFLGKCPAYFT